MGDFDIANTEQVTAETASDGEWAGPLNLRQSRGRCDAAVETSGSATLTVAFSSTGEFAGEEFVVTADYDSATDIIEQFDPAHQHVRAKVDANLTRLELVARGG